MIYREERRVQAFWIEMIERAQIVPLEIICVFASYRLKKMGIRRTFNETAYSRTTAPFPRSIKWEFRNNKQASLTKLCRNYAGSGEYLREWRKADACSIDCNFLLIMLRSYDPRPYHCV